MAGPNTSLSALNDMMFAQLEALSNPDLTKEELETERQRADSMAKIGKIMVSNAAVELKALALACEYAGAEAAPALKGQSMFLVEGATDGD